MNVCMYIFFYVYVLSLLFQLFFLYSDYLYLFCAMFTYYLPHCWRLSGYQGLCMVFCYYVVKSWKHFFKNNFGHKKRNTQHDGTAVPGLKSNIWPTTISALTCTDINYQA